MTKPWWMNSRLLAEDDGEGSGEGSGGGEGADGKSTISKELEKDEGSGDDSDKSKDKSDEGKDDKKAEEGKEDKEGSDDGEGEGDESKKDGEQEPVDFAKIEMPEGSTIDEKTAADFLESDFGKKLTQDDAQELVEFATKWRESQTQQVVDEHNDKLAGWDKDWSKSETVAKEFEGSLEQANVHVMAAVKEFFPKVDADLWDATGFGSNPEVLKGMATIAKKLKLVEANMEGGGGRPPEKSTKNAAHSIFKAMHAEDKERAAS